MTVVTVNTDESIALDNWKLSLTNNGYSEYAILGLGQKWRGFKWRSKMYLKYLRKLKQQYGGNHIVMTCDSTDVLFLQPMNDLVHKFKVLEQTVVVSADDTQLVGQFANGLTRELAAQIIEKRLGERSSSSSKTNKQGIRTCPRYMWVNAGLCIGYVDYVIALYERLKSYEDDQEGLQIEWLADPDLCFIDYHQHLFANLSGMRHIVTMNRDDLVNDLVFDHEHNRYKHRVTKTWPSVVHFPGKITTTYNNFVKRWHRDTRDLDSAEFCWQEDLRIVSNRGLGGFWSISFYAKTLVKAHRREIKVGISVMAAVVISFVIWKILKHRRNTTQYKGVLSSGASQSLSMLPNLQVPPYFG